MGRASPLEVKQHFCEQQPTELYYKFEKNYHLESQTTAFTCMCTRCLQNHLLNASAWVKAWVEFIWFPHKYEQNECLHREKQWVWNFFITWQFHWLSLAISWQRSVKQWAYKTAACITGSARKSSWGQS